MTAASGASDPIMRASSVGNASRDLSHRNVTYAATLAFAGIPSVVFGPGDIRVAHRTGEFVPVAELREAVSILRRMIERFCAAGHQ